MNNYICPFTNSICKPTCEYWKSDAKMSESFFGGFIPVNITMNDITNYIMPRMSKSGKKWIPLILLQLKNFYSNSTEFENVGNGRCTRLSKENNE